MPTIAIVGAGPGLGLSVGRVFGKAGFEVALVARSHETIDQLLPLLRADTIGQVHWDLYTRREEVEHVHLPA